MPRHVVACHGRARHAAQYIESLRYWPQNTYINGKETTHGMFSQTGHTYAHTLSQELPGVGLPRLSDRAPLPEFELLPRLPVLPRKPVIMDAYLDPATTNTIHC